MIVNPDIRETVSIEKERQALLKEIKQFTDECNNLAKEIRDTFTEAKLPTDTAMIILLDVLAYYICEKQLGPERANLLLAISVYKEQMRRDDANRKD